MQPKAPFGVTVADVEALPRPDPPKPRIGRPPKKKRGKPRRGSAVAHHCSVRIDSEARTLLELQFGSLGNALYHTYRGILEFQAQVEERRLLAEAASHSPDPPVSDSMLPESDWQLIAQILQRAADKAPEPDHYRRTAMDIAPEKDTGKRFKNATHPTLKPTEADRIEMALRRLEFALGRPPRGRSSY